MTLQALADQLGIAFLAEPWVPQVFLIIALTVAANLVASRLLQRLLRVSQLSAGKWDDALILASSRPLPVGIWIVGLATAALVAGENTRSHLFASVPSLRNIGVVIVIAWFLLRLIRFGTEATLEGYEKRGEEVDPSTLDALSKLARLSVILTTVLVAMQTLGISISGILAAGGIGGIAIGFAAKDLLANFFGGLTIYLDRPFTVGDWIRSPDKDIEGTVEYISWRHTRIRRFNKNPLYVPNALFTTIAVENPSRMTNRRIKETLGIRYRDIGAMAAIVQEVKDMLSAHPEIDTEQALIVNFNTFGPSSLDFFIYTFTKTREWVRFHEIKQEILLQIAGIIARHGAEIAFPTRSLHVESMPPAADAGSP